MCKTSTHRRIICWVIYITLKKMFHYSITNFRINPKCKKLIERVYINNFPCQKKTLWILTKFTKIENIALSLFYYNILWYLRLKIKIILQLFFAFERLITIQCKTSVWRYSIKLVVAFLLPVLWSALTDITSIIL